VTETKADGGKPEGPTGTTLGDVKEVIRESQRLAGLRIAAMSQGGFSAAEQAEYGTTADGAPAEGGLTPAGIKFADAARRDVNDFVRKHLGRHHQEHPPARKPAAASPLDTLGLTGPFRAALKAGALALAAALDDGVSDGGVSEGVQVDEDGNEFTTVKLGHKPYVLIELDEHEDMPGVLLLGVSAGGGVTRDNDPDREPDQPTIGELLERAAATNAASAAAGVGNGEVGIVDVTSEGVPQDMAERAARMMGRAFGADHVHVVRRSGEGGSTSEASEAEGLIRGLLGGDFMPLRDPGEGEGEGHVCAPRNSGAGPSTEAPSMPHWGPEPEPFDTPREGDAGAPGGPVRDDEGAPTSTPARPLRDDVGAPSPDPATSSAFEAAGSSGGTDSAGSTGGGSE
jgi:hypothetical protein